VISKAGYCRNSFFLEHLRNTCAEFKINFQDALHSCAVKSIRLQYSIINIQHRWMYSADISVPNMAIININIRYCCRDNMYKSGIWFSNNYCLRCRKVHIFTQNRTSFTRLLVVYRKVQI